MARCHPIQLAGPSENGDHLVLPSLSFFAASTLGPCSHRSCLHSSQSSPHAWELRWSAHEFSIITVPLGSTTPSSWTQAFTTSPSANLEGGMLRCCSCFQQFAKCLCPTLVTNDNSQPFILLPSADGSTGIIGAEYGSGRYIHVCQELDSLCSVKSSYMSLMQPRLRTFRTDVTASDDL